MQLDKMAFQIPLPRGVQAFASGANRAAEIRGFARLGIPVGVSVNHLNDAAIAELIALRQPVMLDSGAFSEVVFTREGPRVTSRITDQEWRRRLGIYLRLSASLHANAMLVVPDQVGNQEETLRRLKTYRVELSSLADMGAILLLPLQVGALSHSEFLQAAELAAGVPLTPAMPMRKAATSVAALAEFIQEVKPDRIHLLGMGLDNRQAGNILRLIRHFSPGTAISLDSNRIRAVTGNRRPLTILEAQLRAAETRCLSREVDSSVLDMAGKILDYTEHIAVPSAWCTPQQLTEIAVATAMLPREFESFLRDPDKFLQTSFRGSTEALWNDHPLMNLELDRAWEDYVHKTIRSSIRTAAIVGVFQHSPARRLNSSMRGNEDGE